MTRFWMMVRPKVRKKLDGENKTILRETDIMNSAMVGKQEFESRDTDWRSGLKVWQQWQQR